MHPLVARPEGILVLIGSVADDITGATDLCLTLSRSGMHTVQVIGVPDTANPLPDADAVVVALKSRTVPSEQAVKMSVGSAKALIGAGAEQILFKYCSTFDSTDAGNIGPVTDALMVLLDTDLTIACPAFPANGRTVYKGHLFVGDQLLSDSPMKDHPLTPMRDANLVRVLGRQSKSPIGLVDSSIIALGPQAVAHAFAKVRADGQKILVVDTLNDADLLTVGEACSGFRLVTGGSGIALGLAANFVRAGRAGMRQSKPVMAAPKGRSVTLAGSCSVATLSQIDAARRDGAPLRAIDADSLAAGRDTAAAAADWAIAATGDVPPVIYSSADPQALASVHARLGREAAGAMVEQVMADIAVALKEAGFTRFLVAGGETSGAVVEALGVRMLEIGPEIDPGVPWTRSVGGPDLALALKSGNFGQPDFFLRAWSLLGTDAAR
jgi:uncharacterized protein YgbK (DUF1537 family)